MKKKYLLILLGVFLVAGFAGLIYFASHQVEAGVGSGVRSVIGSRTGTTTVGTGFYSLPATNGTTSAPIFIGSNTDNAIFTIKITAASSTPSGLFSYQILGSNDNYCNTATTTTTMNDTVIKKDINWYALGNEGQVVSTGAVATGTVLSLTNLSWSCLNFQANGSSTEVMVQMIDKDNL